MLAPERLTMGHYYPPGYNYPILSIPVQSMFPVLNQMVPSPRPDDRWVRLVAESLHENSPGDNICVFVFAEHNTVTDPLELLAVMAVDKDVSVPVRFLRNKEQITEWFEANRDHENSCIASAIKATTQGEDQLFTHPYSRQSVDFMMVMHPDKMPLYMHRTDREIFAAVFNDLYGPGFQTIIDALITALAPDEENQNTDPNVSN